MKITKLIVLLASVSILAACGKSTSKSNAVSSNNVVSSSEAVTESSQEPSVTSSSETVVSSSSAAQISSSTQASSSTQTSSSTNATTSSSVAVQGNELSVSFYNPSCGTASKEIVNETLKTYINEVAGTTFVSSITGHDCQITNDIPSKGEHVLQIGAAAKDGSLEFTFANTVKAVTIMAQTYHKPYVDTWSSNEPITISNTDPNSMLQITTTGNAGMYFLDLKPDEDEQPVEKEFSLDINSNKLRLNNTSDDKGRVFIKSIKFVY